MSDAVYELPQSCCTEIAKLKCDPPKAVTSWKTPFDYHFHQGCATETEAATWGKEDSENTHPSSGLCHELRENTILLHVLPLALLQCPPLPLVSTRWLSEQAYSFPVLVSPFLPAHKQPIENWSLTETGKLSPNPQCPGVPQEIGWDWKIVPMKNPWNTTSFKLQGGSSKKGFRHHDTKRKRIQQLELSEAIVKCPHLKVSFGNQEKSLNYLILSHF